MAAEHNLGFDAGLRTRAKGKPCGLHWGPGSDQYERQPLATKLLEGRGEEAFEIPVDVTLRITLFWVSAITMFPEAFTATARGPHSIAEVAGLPSPLKPPREFEGPLPATVVMMPVDDRQDVSLRVHSLSVAFKKPATGDFTNSQKKPGITCVAAALNLIGLMSSLRRGNVHMNTDNAH